MLSPAASGTLRRWTSPTPARACGLASPPPSSSRGTPPQLPSPPAQLPRHHPPLPQPHLCTTSRLSAPRRATTRGGRQAHPEGVLAERRVTQIARAPDGQLQHLPPPLAHRQHPVAPTDRCQTAGETVGETEDDHDSPCSSTGTAPLPIKLPINGTSLPITGRHGPDDTPILSSQYVTLR